METTFDDKHPTRFLLNEEQAASRLGLSIKTLQAWRWTGRGPPYIKISHRAVRYRYLDLMEWIERRVRRSTAEEK